MGSNPERALDRLYDEREHVDRQLAAAEHQALGAREWGDEWEAMQYEKEARNLRQRLATIINKIDAIEAQVAY